MTEYYYQRTEKIENQMTEFIVHLKSRQVRISDPHHKIFLSVKNRHSDTLKFEYRSYPNLACGSINASHCVCMWAQREECIPTLHAPYLPDVTSQSKLIKPDFNRFQFGNKWCEAFFWNFIFYIWNILRTKIIKNIFRRFSFISFP